MLLVQPSFFCSAAAACTCHILSPPPPPAPLPPTRSDGRIGTNWLATITKSLGLSVEPWVRGLQGTQFASADRVELVTLFGYLEFCLNQIVMDNELGALREVRALVRWACGAGVGDGEGGGAVLLNLP